MRRVEISGLRGYLGAVELTVALDVACHSVDKVSQGNTGIGVVGVIVDDRGGIHGA